MSNQNRTENGRASKEEYLSAALYFAPFCLPYAIVSVYLYTHLDDPTVLWLVMAAVALVTWILVTIEAAEF